MKVGTWRGRRWGAAKGAPAIPERGEKEGVPALGMPGRGPCLEEPCAGRIQDMCRLAGGCKGRGTPPVSQDRRGGCFPLEGQP